MALEHTFLLITTNGQASADTDRIRYSTRPFTQKHSQTQAGSNISKQICRGQNRRVFREHAWVDNRTCDFQVTSQTLYPLGHDCSHCYADDTQLYISTRPDETKLSKITACVKNVKVYNHFLLLNSDKT